MSPNVLTGILGVAVGGALVYLSTLPALAANSALLLTSGVGLITGSIGLVTKRPSDVAAERKARGNGKATNLYSVVLLALLPATPVLHGCGHGPALERAAEKAAPLLLELAKSKGVLLDKADAICMPLPDELVTEELPGAMVMCYAPEAEEPE